MFERPIRVLIVSNMYPSGDHPAFGVFVRAQVEALRTLGGVEIEVFHWDAGRRPWRYATAAARLRLRHADADADIIHAHYGLSGFVALAAPATVPLVLTVHGRDCHHPAVRPLTARAARRAACVIAVSDELAGICPFTVDEVVPPGADLSLFTPMTRADARQRLGLDPARRLVLFPSDPKRPEKRYADVHALLAAVRATGRIVDLQALVARPRDEVPLWINAADAVLIPSAREGYGLACVEALACEVPVLSTPVGVAPSLLSQVEGTLCAPFSIETWQPVLERLLDDPDPHVRGRAVAETQSVSATARHLRAIYRRVRAARP